MKRTPCIFALMLILLLPGCTGTNNSPTTIPEKTSDVADHEIAPDAAEEELDSTLEAENPDEPELPVLGNPPLELELPLELQHNSIQCSAGTFMVVAPNGDLVGWGNSENGDLPGTGTLSFEERRVFLENIQEVYCGYGIGGALDRDGNFYVWASAAGGLDVPAIPENPDIFLAMDQVRTADVGLGYAAAIREDGSLWLWGSNQYGKLGNGQEEYRLFPPEQRMEHAAMVLCGTAETFVLTEEGDLYAFGVVGGPTPVCIGNGFTAIGESFGYGPTLLTADGQVQTTVTAEDGELQFLTCAENAAQLVPGGYIDRDGVLWQLRMDLPPLRLADGAVDACRDGLGTMLYLSSDGVLHKLDEATGDEVWNWPLNEISP